MQDLSPKTAGVLRSVVLESAWPVTNYRRKYATFVSHDLRPSSLYVLRSDIGTVCEELESGMGMGMALRTLEQLDLKKHRTLEEELMAIENKIKPIKDEMLAKKKGDMDIRGNYSNSSALSRALSDNE
jgi:hypothetical protein